MLWSAVAPWWGYLSSNHPHMVGRTITHYRVVAVLGEGGMGVVFQAEDTQLGRTVALKALPAPALIDETRRARFLLEARATSALNHPNLVTVYDLVREGDSDFLVMEFVDGKTLEQILHERRLSLSESLRIAISIADAVAAAHRAGFVHRDLKPGNIMVSRNGVVKVLDFGLAKLIEPERPGSDAESVTTGKTAEGIIVGTVAYMSPEQAQAKEVDARSDIFSFGAVLYEMITGRRAFQADNHVSALGAVIAKDPKPLSEIVSNIPRETGQLVSRCLRKDPGKRWQTMADLKVALDDLKVELDSGRLADAAPIASAKRPGTAWRWGIGVAAGLLLCAVAFWAPLGRTPRADGMRKIPLTTYPGSELEPSFSPDGKQVAFIWSGAQDENRDVYVKLVDAGEPLRLTQHPASESNPRWSPDGRQIAFFREGSIYVVPPLGGAERKLVNAQVLSTFDWHPDGKSLVIAEEAGLHWYSLESGERRRLTTPSAAGGRDEWPVCSPDGNRVAFVRVRSELGQRDVMVVPVSGGEPQAVVVEEGFNQTPTWTANGRELVFSRQWSSLFRVAVAGGRPVRIGEADDNAGTPAVSRTGKRLVYSKSIQDMNIWTVDVTSKAQPQRVIASTQRDFSVAVSPEGGRLAFTSDRSGGWEIWASDSLGGKQTQLTSFGGSAIVDGARWSPDGKEIAFSAMVNGNRDIYTIDADGGTPRRLTSETSDEGRPGFSRDGKSLYFRSNRSGRPEIWRMPRSGGPAEQVTQDGGFDAQESPDSAAVYFTKARRQPGLWKVPVSGGETTPIPGLERVRAGRWALTGVGVFWFDQAVASSTILRRWDPVKNASEPIVTIAAPIWDSAPMLSVTPDGRQAYWHQDDWSGADLVLLENFQ